MAVWDACAFRPTNPNWKAVAAAALTFQALRIYGIRVGVPTEDEDDKYIILPYFWIPEDNIDLRVRVTMCRMTFGNDRIAMTTEGNVVHYGYIEKLSSPW